MRRHSAATLLIGAYIVFFAGLSIRAHQGFRTGAFDVGIFDQGVYLLSRLQAPFVTLNGRNLFADHASFVLLPVVPVYWVFAHVSVLLVLQSAAIGLAGVPVYKLALNQLGSETLATMTVAAFLLNPALQLGNMDEFHPEAFLVLAAATALYAAVVWNPRLLAIAAVGCMLVKEDSVLFVLPLAVWVAFRRDRRLGRNLAVGSVVYAALMMLVFMKALGGGPTIYASRTFPFGSLGGTVSTAVLRPGDMIDYLTSQGRLFYLWQLALPTALAFLRAPGLAAVALPVVAYNVVSAFPYQHQIDFHYSLVLVPILTAASIGGLAAFRSARLRALATTAVLAGTLAAAHQWGVAPTGPGIDYRPRDHPHTHQIEEVLHGIPDGAVISTFYTFAPHLSHRKQIYMWPNPFRAAYWGRFDREGECLPRAESVRYLALPNDNGDFYAEDEQQIFERLRPRLQPVVTNDYATLYRITASTQATICETVQPPTAEAPSD